MAPVEFSFERSPLVLDAGIDAHHVVVHGVGDTRSKKVGREDDAAVRQPDLAVLDAVVWLALLLFGAERVVHANPRRNRLVLVEIAERAIEAELARRRSHWSMYDWVLNLLSICAALTPSVLRLLATIAMYLNFVLISPFSHTPVVYQPRKNSSAISRSSTPAGSGNCPSVLRTAAAM